MEGQAMTMSDVSEAPEAVAIIGLAGRFPGASTAEAFWNNLKNGVESIRFFSDEELTRAGVPSRMLDNPAYVKARAALDDIELFDAGFFGFTPREAELADPQHRVFLECVWHALENAGYDTARYPGVIGLYGGVSMNSYLITNLLSNRRLIDAMGLLQTAILNRTDHLTTHTAYKLNLKGPSVTVQTTCSTSLVAVHMACQALISYHCDVALAGGVTVAVPNRIGYLYQEGGIGSPDGHCRAFDARANGTVSGSGAGVVVLKRLTDALADGDCIRAVIRSTAINNDGAEKIGYTAPSVAGQAQAIAMAQAIAGISPEDISYIEAHGTGTPLGDPIEIEALTQVFRRATARKGFCAIGSVKTNIGHLDTAAGIAGLIKTTLALEHRQLPPSLHFSQPNPRINFADSPFRVNAALSEWNTDGRPRMAGVSSFGIGGTNAHVIVEEAPQVERRPASGRHQLLVVSARTKSALETMVANLAAHLRDHPELDLGDVAYTLQVGRRSLGQRRAFVCRDREDALSVLAMSDVSRVVGGAKEAVKRPVAFMFPGQGSQHVNAAVELYESEPVFRREVDRCSKLLEPQLGCRLQDVLFTSQARIAETTQKLQRTAFAQPGLFVIEYALARLLMEWGIQPQAMIGHSLGEYVAACLAGVFSLEDGLRLVAARGRLMQTLPGGSMLSVSLSEKELSSRLRPGLEIAAVNSPALCVVSGTHAAVNEFEAELLEQGVACLRLHTSHAFHSSMMEPIIDEFLHVFDTITLRPPSSPYISSLTGKWITSAEATSPSYWARHLRNPVQFGAGLSVLFDDPAWILLEVGPGRALMSIARRHPQKSAGQMVLHSLPPPDSNRSSAEVALLTLGQLWASGVEPNWDALHESDRRGRVPLPAYPFDRQRYWIEAKIESPVTTGSLEKDPDPANWFYVPGWKRALQLVKEERAVEPKASRWLVFADAFGVGAQLADWIRQFASSVVTVTPADDFAQRGSLDYALDPADPAGYVRLFGELERNNLMPERIVHAWGVAPPVAENISSDGARAAPPSFYSLLYVAQALGTDGNGRAIHIDIVASNVNEVTGAEIVCPEHSMLVGPCLVVPQEYAGVTCRLIDVDFAEVAGADDARVPESLFENLREPDTQSVAFRNGHRWVQFFEQVPMERPSGLPLRLRERGVYLITGGLGGMGRAVANYLARTVPGARLVLIGRSPLPPRERWHEWIGTHSEQNREGRLITALTELESGGAEVVYFSADVSDASRLREIVEQATERFGPINGVVHTAGVPGSGIIQLKTAAKADQVLAAKVTGTRALYSVLNGRELDFSILCSSRSALLGGLGSVDYCAANSYLDAFAHRRRKQTGEFVVSVNWPAWQEVGMLADTAAAHRARREAPARNEDHFGHPLIDRHVSHSPDRHVFRSRFAVKSQWILDEHRILGNAVVPGVTYLEMARAAFEKVVHAGPIELSDVYFLTPMRMKDDEASEVRLVFERAGEGYDFYVESAPAAAAESAAWLRHVIGKIAARPAAEPRRLDIASLIAECGRKELRLTEENFFDENLGPRWQCANRVYLGEKKLLAELRLSDEYSDDLQQFRLHPSLLDRAAGIGVLFLVERQSGYLPFSYGRLRLHAPLQQRIYIYSRGGEDPATNAETTAFDVDIIAEDGTVLAEIQKFSHKRINEIGRAVNTLMAGNQGGRESLQPAAEQSRGNAGDEAASPFDQVLSLGITATEGVDVFSRMLTRRVPPQVVVSPSSLPAVIEWARQARPDNYEEKAESLPAPSTHARPGLETAFVPPSSDLERRLATVWQECLGIDQVGLHDNFFELGGNSVLAIQIMANARKAGLNFSVQQLFQHSTIAALAGVMEGARANTADDDRQIPLLPAQTRWFESSAESWSSAAWSLLLEVDSSIDAASLQQALLQLGATHEALRLYFPADRAPRLPSLAATSTAVALETIDIGELAEPDRLPTIMAVAERMRSQLQIERGPLVKFALFRASAGEKSALLITAHAIVADLGSARILSKELQTALESSQRDREPPSSDVPDYQQAAGWALEFAASTVARKEMSYWTAMQNRRPPLWPAARQQDETAAPEMMLHRVCVGRHETKTLLGQALRAYHARVEDFVLAGLVKVLCAQARDSLVWIDYRSRLGQLPGGNLQGVIGPFGTVAPVVFETSGSDDPGALLTTIKEQLRAVPRGGSAYALLEGEEALPRPPIAFAHLGVLDDALDTGSGLRLHPSTPLLSLEVPEASGYAISVLSFVHAQQLHIHWSYDRRRVADETLSMLARTQRNEMMALVHHCVAVEAEVFTPSDFPLADLDAKKLRQIFKLLDKADRSAAH